MVKELEILAKGAAVAFMGKSMGILLIYLFTLIIAWLAGPEVMGTFFLGVTLMTVLGTFSTFGLDTGLLRFVSVYKSQGKYNLLKGAVLKSSYFSFCLSLIVGLVLFSLSGYLSTAVFSDPDLTPVLKISAFAIPFYSVRRIILGILRGFKAISLIVINNDMVFPLLSIGLLFMFYLFIGRSVISTAVAYCLSIFLAFLLALVFLLRVFPDITRVPTESEFKKILKYSAPLLLVAVMGLVMSWIDIVMVGVIKTSRDVGVYTAASRTAAFVAFFLVSVNSIAPSLFAEYHSNGKLGELGTLARTSARWVFYFSLPVAVLFILLSKEIMRIYGAEFIVGARALSFLSVGQLINASTGSVGYILMMTGHQKRLSSIIFSSAVLNIILNAFLIPKWGISGAGLATAFSLAFLNILAAWAVYRDVGVKAYTDRILTVGAICIIGTVAFLISKAAFGPYLAAVTFITLYFGLLYLIGLKEEDKEFLILVKHKLKGESRYGS